MTYRFTEYFLLRAFVAPPNVTYADSGRRCQWCLLGWEGGGGVTGRFGMLNWRRGFSLRDCTFYFGANAMREMPSANLLQMKETRTRPRNNHRQSSPLPLFPHTFIAKVFTPHSSVSLPPRLLSLSHAALYAKCSHFQLN